MNKILVAILVLAGAVLVSGCTQVKDCGSDTECFLEAAKACSPAKLISSITSGEGDYRLSIEVESRIGGMQGNDCIFSLQVKDLTVPPKIPSDLASGFNALRGSQMVCRVPKNVEIKTFDELKEQVMNVYNERCTGTYKTLSEQLYQKTQEKLKEVSEGIEFCAGAFVFLQTGMYDSAKKTLELVALNSGNVNLTEFNIFITHFNGSVSTTTHNTTIAAGDVGTLSISPISSDIRQVTVRSEECSGAQDTLSKYSIIGLS